MREILRLWRFRLLLPSIISLCISHIFFVTHYDLFNVLLVGGLIASCLLVFINLMTNWKAGLAAVLAMMVGAILFTASEKVLKERSFHMFIQNHDDELNQAVRLLQSLDLEAHMRFSARDSCTVENGLRPDDCRMMRALMEQIEAVVWKRDGAIVFELGGMLDERWGILYCPDESLCKSGKQQHLTRAWYRWWSN